MRDSHRAARILVPALAHEAGILGAAPAKVRRCPSRRCGQFSVGYWASHFSRFMSQAYSKSFSVSSVM